MTFRFAMLFATISLFFMVSCNSGGGAEDASGEKAKGLSFSEDNAGLQLPAGFHTVVVADNIGEARHLAIRDNGDIYVALNAPHEGHTIAALRDSTGDGVADEVVYFGNLIKGTGMRIYNGYLYYGSDTAVVRYKLLDNQLLPDTVPEIIVHLFPQNEHEARSLAFDNSGHMYINIGAPSNACQVENRTKGSPGQMPCPLLKTNGAVWQFDANKPDQSEENGGVRYITGIRNCVGLDWDTNSGELYATMHGRDQLSQLYPQYYSEEESAELPGEEFLLLKKGANFGWPYTYWDPKKEELMVAPEYGGDGKKASKENYEKPLMSFPAHWAPDGLLFYSGSQFPDEYKNGAFIAFHGSWNRAPEPQKGYRVTFVPFNGSVPAGGSEIFADGFTGKSGELMSPGDAAHRPCGLAQGPDGSLYVSDDAGGSIYRIVYEGQKAGS